MRAPDRLLHAVAALWAATAAVAQLPLSLDTSFQTELISQNVNSIALLSNGKVLLSGLMKYPGDMNFRGASRLWPDGTRDLGFPSFPLSTGGAKLTPWNGQFYVSNGTVRRLLPDGTIDNSFIHMNTGPYFSSGASGDYHVYPDGRILMGGGSHILSDSTRGFVGSYDLCWFSNTGYLDTTKTHRKGVGALSYFKELPNGQFIGSGNITQWEGKQVDWIFRMNADGAPDTTFRTGVVAGVGHDFIGLPDGRVYVGGSFKSTQSPDSLELVRFNPDGTLDLTFNTPQFDDLGINGPNNGATIVALYPWPNNRLLVVGLFRTVNGEPRNSICVIDSTGALGPEFDACGVDVITFNQYDYADIAQVVIDTANQHIYICGAYWGYDDGTGSGPNNQRFVSRLHLGNFGMNVPQEQTPESVQQLMVLPNPSSSAAQLTWSLAPHLAKGKAQLSVVSSSGAVQLSEQLDLSRGTHTLDVQALASGVYYLHVVQEHTWITGAKLMVE